MVIQWLAQTTGKSVVKHPQVQCQLTISSSKKLTTREAIHLIVLNDTRVLPARVVGRRERTGGKWEGLFLREAGGAWEMLAQTLLLTNEFLFID